MPITVNDGGVLYALDTVTANEGGVLYALDTVHANEGGVLYEIHGSNAIPKTLTWTAGSNGSFEIKDLQGFKVYMKTSGNTAISNAFKTNGCKVSGTFSNAYFPKNIYGVSGGNAHAYVYNSDGTNVGEIAGASASGDNSSKTLSLPKGTYTIHFLLGGTGDCEATLQLNFSE